MDLRSDALTTEPTRHPSWTLTLDTITWLAFESFKLKLECFVCSLVDTVAADPHTHSFVRRPLVFLTIIYLLFRGVGVGGWVGGTRGAKWLAHLILFAACLILFPTHESLSWSYAIFDRIIFRNFFFFFFTAR